MSRGKHTLGLETLKTEFSVAKVACLALVAFVFLAGCAKAVVVTDSSYNFTDFSLLYESVKRQVVFIRTISKPDDKDKTSSRSSGSGVVISSKKAGDGYESLILTNWHVVEEAERIRVYPFGGQGYPAHTHGHDVLLDLALLKVKTPNRLPPASLGDSASLKIGEWLFAVGNPLGLRWSLSIGVVGNLGQDLLYDTIQFDGAINPGNSGGALFNLTGELVGIPAMTQVGAKIGYAISINRFKHISSALLKGGKVPHSFLGVEIEDLFSLEENSAKGLGLSYPLSREEGVVITKVDPGTPADSAGIKKGDIVLAVNNVEARNTRHCQWLVADHPPEKEMTLKILRGKDELVIKVMPTERSD